MKFSNTNILSMNNYAFIDWQNLNLGIKSQWRDIDLKRFRIYIKDKFKVTSAYYFLWYVPWNESLYTYLQSIGYILIFKPTLQINWKIKWNCDAELVLHTMINFNNFDNAVIVTWDWDFHCLIEHLQQENKLYKVIVPDQKNYSSLLKKFANYLFFLSHKSLQWKIGKQKKRG